MLLESYLVLIEIWKVNRKLSSIGRLSGTNTGTRRLAYRAAREVQLIRLPAAGMHPHLLNAEFALAKSPTFGRPRNFQQKVSTKA